MSEQKIITKYIKDRVGHIATIVAVKTEKGVVFGYSKYHRKVERKPFLKKFGRKIAIQRALMDKNPDPMPFAIQDNIGPFIKRCESYFKGDEIIQPR